MCRDHAPAFARLVAHAHAPWHASFLCPWPSPRRRALPRTPPVSSRSRSPHRLPPRDGPTPATLLPLGQAALARAPLHFSSLPHPRSLASSSLLRSIHRIYAFTLILPFVLRRTLRHSIFGAPGWTINIDRRPRRLPRPRPQRRRPLAVRTVKSLQGDLTRSAACSMRTAPCPCFLRTRRDSSPHLRGLVVARGLRLSSARVLFSSSPLLPSQGSQPRAR